MGGASLSLLPFGLLSIERKIMSVDTSVLLYSENALLPTSLIPSFLPSFLPTFFPSPPPAAGGGSVSHKSKLVKKILPPWSKKEERESEKTEENKEQSVGLELQH